MYSDQSLLVRHSKTLEYKDYVRYYVGFDPEAPSLTESMNGPQHGGGSDLKGYALQEDREDVL